jgi:hypothetical protein
MVDQGEELEEGVGAQSTAAPDPRSHPGDAPAKEPGWYPSRANPNEQSYWDGETWTAKRRWTVGGWVEHGTVPPAAAGDGAPAPAPRPPANVYAPQAASPRSSSAPVALSIGTLLLAVSGIALMYGSVGTWVNVSGSVRATDFHLSVDGTNPIISHLIGIDGYATFIGGIVLLVFAAVAMTNDDRFLSIFVAVVAGVVTVLAVYDMFRMVQKISQVTTSAGSSVSVGWGLICVLAAAVLAFVVALTQVVSR